MNKRKKMIRRVISTIFVAAISITSPDVLVNGSENGVAAANETGRISQ